MLPGHGLASDGAILNLDDAIQLANPADADVMECPLTHYGPGGNVNSICLPCPAYSSSSTLGASGPQDCNGKSGFAFGAGN